MTLLCMQCNQKRKRGTLSRETVKKANKVPKCLEKGYAKELFDYGNYPIEILFAGNRFINCNHIICINDIPILSINKPVHKNDTFLLSGFFHDSNNKKIFRIDNNSWFAESNNWDIECKGQRITIKEKNRKIVLVIKQEPPALFTIEKINMKFDDMIIIGDKDGLSVFKNGQDIYSLKISNSTISSFNIGVSISSENVSIGLGKVNPFFIKIIKISNNPNFLKYFV